MPCFFRQITTVLNPSLLYPFLVVFIGRYVKVLQWAYILFLFFSIVRPEILIVTTCCIWLARSNDMSANKVNKFKCLNKLKTNKFVFIMSAEIYIKKEKLKHFILVKDKNKLNHAMHHHNIYHLFHLYIPCYLFLRRGIMRERWFNLL